MKFNLKSIGLLSLFAVAGASFAAPIVDGLPDAGYQLIGKMQDTLTSFGENESEINGVFFYRDATDLYVFVGGNVQNNFNKMEIFLDYTAGGQNRLLLGQPDVDFNGVARMADDGSGNGLTFDAGFEADHLVWFGSGGDPVTLYGNNAPIGAATFNGYLGNNAAGALLTGGENPFGFEMANNVSNKKGVNGGSETGNNLDPFNLSVTGVASGAEFRIPLAAIGNPTGDIKVCAFVNGGGHDFMSNQVINGIGGGWHLGEPRLVNFDNIAGAQFVTVPAASGLKISGVMTLEGRTNAAGGVNVELRQGATTINTVALLDAAGNYEVGVPSSGTWTVSAKPAGMLRKNGSAAAGGTVNLSIKTGDIIGDNVIDLSDYTQIAVNFNKLAADPEWITVDENGRRVCDSDLNNDGVVDLTDYTYVATNFNALGDN